jgi:hypothetical protein
VTSAFAHFDASHRENFCAALLLLVMELEPPAKQAIAATLLATMGLSAACELVGMGREARLVEGDPDDGVARVDLWFLFRDDGAFFYVFVEVKTHLDWDAHHVARQVSDQARRPRLARTTHPIRGSVLLAPWRLVERVRAENANVLTLTWGDLFAALRATENPSPLLRQALRHWEDLVDRPVGIANRPFADFVGLSSTMACLRAFLSGCIVDIGGKDGHKLNTTPADGEPLRWSGWAWHGFSIPFTVGAQKFRLGIYSYVEAPAGEQSACETPWLEVYEESAQEPLVFLPFAPATLAPPELDALRQRFKAAWQKHIQTSSAPPA